MLRRVNNALCRLSAEFDDSWLGRAIGVLSIVVTVTALRIISEALQ